MPAAAVIVGISQHLRISGLMDPPSPLAVEPQRLSPRRELWDVRVEQTCLKPRTLPVGVTQSFILKLFFAHSYSWMETGPTSLMTVEMHMHVYCTVTDESWVNHRLGAASSSARWQRSPCVHNMDGRQSLYLECMKGKMRGGGGAGWGDALPRSGE